MRQVMGEAGNKGGGEQVQQVTDVAHNRSGQVTRLSQVYKDGAALGDYIR